MAMRPFVLVLIALTVSLSGTGSELEQPARITELFNFGWKFHFGIAEGAQSVDYDDYDWISVDLPHDFQMAQPWDKNESAARGFKAMGEGWYRKTFTTDPTWKGKRVFLDFEGIMLTGEIWINGEKVGSADYGYLGTEIDISDHLLEDSENVVVVRASTGKADASRWYTGGGLFRDVHLIVKNPIAIARHGVFITTPHVAEKRAEIDIQVALEGMTRNPVDVAIRTKVFSPSGEVVAKSDVAAPTDSKLKICETNLPPLTVENPELWSCEYPNLYSAEVSLIRDGIVIDQVTEVFGIRTIEFSPEFGLKLNGKKVFLKGIANHCDVGALGVAVYNQAIERLFRRLKEFGFNHVRTSHNPYSESFLKLADRYGILVVDEAFDKWGDELFWPGGKPFSEIWYQIVPEWIKRDRNHPSVILWSLGNELQNRESLAGFPTGDWGVTTYKILDVLVKRYDPTRKTTVAMHPSRANAVSKRDPEFALMIPPELSLVTEVASYNYQYPAYSTYLERAPDLTIYQSEATTRELGAPFLGMDYEKMVGLAYWGAVEYWGESDGWPKKGWNYSFFNHALEPNPQAYLMKSIFTTEPLVSIGVVESETEQLEWNDVIVGRIPVVSHWNWPEGSQLNLFTYTNAESVELFVNGQSVGFRKNNFGDIKQRNMIYWPGINFGKGGSVIAVANNDGKEVCRYELLTTGSAVRLITKIENDDWIADGMDLQYFKVYAVDSAGNRVLTDGSDVEFEVAGAARLIAVDNGDHLSSRPFSENRITLHHGFAMAILRSNQTSGSVRIKVTSDELESVVCDLKTQPTPPR